MGVGEQLLAGSVTVLIADIDDPASLPESEPEAMTAAMARVEAMLGEASAAHRGAAQARRVDGFMVAFFSTVSDAVGCALDLQRAPSAHAGLRMCLYTADQRDGKGDLGAAADRAERLLMVAHWGQTLLSGAAGDLAADCLPEGAWVEDLGWHRLGDLARPERVWQLCHPAARTEFPALRSLDAFPHNLPVQLTRFIGREAEMTQVRALLAGSRLVTLIGAGGAGKTRLALQVAAGLLTEFPAGVWQVDLAPLTDAALVPVTVARALGLPDEAGLPALATVTGFVGGGRWWCWITASICWMPAR